MKCLPMHIECMYINKNRNFPTGCLVLAGGMMMWFRITMNQGSDPIFKPEEMRAAFHSNRLVRSRDLECKL